MTDATYRAITSTVTTAGKLELGFHTAPIPVPRPHQVLIRMEAVPLNPSDIGFLLGPGDVDTAIARGSPEAPILEMDLRKGALPAFAARVGHPLQIGAEGAGVVVDAGEEAVGLIGKTVSVMVGRMLAEYRCIDAAQCLVMAPGTSAVEAAGAHGNPLTALGMLEVMRRDGHTALVHTAAASNLGQILVKLCRTDGVPLVNIVRRPEQVGQLRALGATHVCDSSAPSFLGDLTAAVKETGATLAFDATGGGTLAGDILTAMDRGVQPGPNARRTPYGVAVHKQVMVYGGLDRTPMVVNRTFGPSWTISNWLMSADEVESPARYEALRQRVAQEIHTTFSSHFGHTVDLGQLLTAEAIQGIARLATGGKYLVRPSA